MSPDETSGVGIHTWAPSSLTVCGGCKKLIIHLAAELRGMLIGLLLPLSLVYEFQRLKHTSGIFLVKFHRFSLHIFGYYPKMFLLFIFIIRLAKGHSSLDELFIISSFPLPLK